MNGLPPARARSPSPSWIWPVVWQSVLSQIGWVGLRVLVGYRALAQGASPTFLGVLAAASAVPFLVGSIPAGKLSNRIGGTPVAFAGIIVSLAGTSSLAFADALWLIVVTTTVAGTGHVMILVGQQTFVASHSESIASDSNFGTMTAAAAVGQLIGAPLAAAASAIGDGRPEDPNTTAGLLATAACVLLAVAPSLVMMRHDGNRRSRRGTRAPQPQSPARELLRRQRVWHVIAVSAAVLVTVDLLYAFIPIWALDRRIDIITVGWLLAVRAITSVLGRIGLGRLVDRFGRRRLLFVATVVGVASLTALPLVDSAGAFVAMVGLGIALGIPQPLTMTWMVGLTTRANYGTALGIRMTANRLTQVALPLLAGSFASALGVAAVFWANAGLLAVAAGIVLVSDPDAEPPPDLDLSQR